MVGCMQREQTTREALIEGRDNTEPKYRPHYIIGVAKSTAEISRNRISLVLKELGRVKERGELTDSVDYCVDWLNTVDRMLADLEAVAS